MEATKSIEMWDNELLPIEKRLEIAIGAVQFWKECHAQKLLQLAQSEADARRLKEIGRKLATAAFNLKQMEGHELTKDNCRVMKDLQEAWDAATPPPTPAALTLSTKTLQQVASESCDEIMDPAYPRYVFTPDDLLVFVEALRVAGHLPATTQPQAAAPAPEVRPAERFHYYSLSFQSGNTTASAYLGYDSQLITKGRIQEAKKIAGVSEDSVLIACCYLGEMTHTEMVGDIDATVAGRG